MPDSIVRTRIEIVGGAESLAQLSAFRAGLAGIGGTPVTLGVNGSALTGAKADVQALGVAHQALGANPAVLGMDFTQITAARGAMRGLETDTLAAANAMTKLAAPLALVAIGAGVTKLGADFQTMTTNIRNNTTMSNADFDSMNASIKRLAVEGGTSLDSLATGYMHAFNLTGDAAKSTADLSIAMKSAVSTGSDVGATTDALAKVMHQFGIEGGDAAKAMDTLHAASAMGNTTLQQFVDASAKSMVTAASLGISLKDVSSAYVGLTRSGFDAGEANTQLAALMVHLIKPSSEARKEIELLAKTTGIDLTNDFTLGGIQAKGLTGVLSDLRAATGGQEDAILKLIPAQRGGIGALALTTSAYKDVIDAGTQLQRVQSGEWTPTADAFARTQQTLGYQLNVFGQQAKQVGIELGQGIVGPLTDLSRVLTTIPAPVIKVGAELVIAALALKGASVVADLLTTSAARLGVGIAGNTAAMVADTVATTLNTGAQEKNALARAGVGGAASVEAASVETAGLAGKVGSAVTGIGAKLGTLIVPVTIGLVAYEIIGKPVEDAIRAKVNAMERPQANIGTLNTDTDQAFADGIKKRLDQQQKIVDEYNSYKNSVGYKVAKIENLGGELQSDKDYKNAIAQIALLKQAELDYQQTHHNTQELGPPLPANFASVVTEDAAALEDLALKYGMIADKRAELQKQGIPDRLINLSLNPEDFGASKLEAARATQAIADLKKDNAAMETARKAASNAYYTDQKQHVADLATMQKQAVTDAATKEKQSITDVATARKQAITETAAEAEKAGLKSAEAWKAANSAVSSVEKAKTPETIGGGAEALDKAQASLAALGKSNPALDALTSIADRFKLIADATDKAKAAFTGYMLGLTQTDAGEAQLKGIQARYLEALNEAEKRQRAGTSTADDDKLVASRANVLGTFAQQQQELSKSASSQMLSIVQNLPNFAAINKMQLDGIAALGGGAKILNDIQTNATMADKQLTDLEARDRSAVEILKANATDAIQQVDTEAKTALEGVAQTEKTALASITTLAQSATRQIDDLMKDRKLNLSVYTSATMPGGNSPYDQPNANGNPAQGAPGAPVNNGVTGGYTFQNLAQADYSKIVADGSGGKQSPFQTPEVYASVLKASQEYNVDPRAILAFTKFENNNATNISPELIAANNFGGVKYVGQAGATQGPAAPANEGGFYAQFPNADAFFKAVAANLTTGAYENSYKAGDLEATRRMYVVGGTAPGSADQERNIANTIDTYHGYQRDYPTPAGGGALITTATGYGPGDRALGSGQVPTGGQVSDVAVGSVRDQIVQKAMQSVGQDKLVGLCETFVEETVEAITGKRGATGKREPTASVAFATAQSQGLVRPANQAPQKGDIVYYPDAAGGVGHTAIYMGDGKQISTWDKGSTSDPEARKIHVESISPGAQFVMVPGTGSDTTRANATIPNAQQGFAPPPGTPNVAAAVGNIDATKQSVQQVTVATADLSKQLGAVIEQFSHMNAPDIKAAQSELQSILPVLTQMQEKKQQVGDTPLTSSEKQDAVNAAWAQGLEFEKQFAITVQNIEHHTNSLAADTQALASIIGGPLASSYAAAAAASAQIAAAQSTMTSLTTAHDAVVQQRQADDQAASRQATREGWAKQDAQAAQQASSQAAQQAQQAQQAALQSRQQAAQNRLADATTAENLRYQNIQRREQDQQRELQFSQQLQATGLQNQLTDTQKQQQSSIYQRTSEEQLMAGRVKGAGTNAEAGALAGQLAGMHESDLATRDKNTREIDGIQLAIREQARKANLESYNLQTETIQSGRAHQDRMNQLTAQGTAQTRMFQAAQAAMQAQSQAASAAASAQSQATQRQSQAQSRADQEKAWALEDSRKAEDTKYKAEMDAQKQNVTTAQAALDAAKQAQQAWQATGSAAVAAAGQASQASATAAAAANPFPSSPVGAPGSGTIRTLSGHAAGGTIPNTERYSLVGERGPEIISAPGYSVTAAPQTAALVAGGATTITMGNITINAAGDDEAIIAATMRQVEAKLRQALRAGKSYRASVGVN